MASMILIAAQRLGSTLYQAGTALDSVTDAALITKLQAEGGVLLPAATVGASATALAQSLQKRGGLFNEDSAASLLLLAAVVGLGAVQFVPDVTLVAGTKTINTGVTIKSTSAIIAYLKTPGGTMGARYKVAKVAGDPGTGSFTITATDAAGATVATDTSVYDVLIVG